MKQLKFTFCKKTLKDAVTVLFQEFWPIFTALAVVATAMIFGEFYE